MPVAVSHGLWDGIQDLDATSQKAQPNLLLRNSGKWERIHPTFAMSSMNFGFRREVTPVMYQSAHGEGFSFNRFDDISLGVICQKVLQREWAFANGGAVVYHTRASNVDANLINEAAGKAAHEGFWKRIWEMSLPANMTAAYLQIADNLDAGIGSSNDEYAYFKQLASNMRRWVDEVGVR